MPKVLHFKKDCISCGACAAIDPERWELDETGLAELKGSTQKEDHQELEISKDQVPLQKEAEACCPVNIIHVKE